MRTTALTSVSVTAASGPFLAASPNRVGIILSSSATFRYTVSPSDPAVANEGIVMPINAGAVILLYDEVGDIVRKKLNAIGGGTFTIGVIEIFP